MDFILPPDSKIQRIPGRMEAIMPKKMSAEAKHDFQGILT